MEMVKRDLARLLKQVKLKKIFIKNNKFFLG